MKRRRGYLTILGSLALSGFLVSAAYAASVTLSWNPYVQGSTIADHFKINRTQGTVCTPVGSTTFPTITPISVTTFTDTTAVVGTTYCYWINAFSAAGESSPDSNYVVHTVPVQGVAAPTVLRIGS